MAEVLAVLGGVASAVHLAEVVGRISTELYGFFRTVKDSPEQIERLCSVLQGLESATRNIQLHNAEHASSIAAAEEHEVLPEVMTNLNDIKTELDALRMMTDPSVFAAGGQASKLGQRIRWMYNKKHVSVVVGRLERHKSNLELAMIAHGLRNDLKMRKDIQAVKTAVSESHSTTLQKINAQNMALSALRSEQEQVQFDVQRLMSLTNQESHLQQQLGKIENTISTSAVVPEVTFGGSQTQNEETKAWLDGAGISNGQDYRQGHMERDIDQLASMVKQLRATEATRNIYAETPETLAKIVRMELQSILVPTIEECLGRYDHRHEAEMRQLQNAITSINLDIFRQPDSFRTISTPFGQDIPCASQTECVQVSGSPLFRNPESDTLGGTHCGRNQTQNNLTFEHRGNSDYLSSSGPDIELVKQSSQLVRRNTTILRRRNWYFFWTIGKVYICIKTLGSRYAAPRYGCRFELSVDFYPSCSFIWRRGFSLMFTTGADQRGYSQLCPIIAWYRIVDMVDICNAIDNSPEPIVEIQHRLENKLIRFTDRDGFGLTYLHYFAMSGRYEICKFLITQGADPSVEVAELTPLHFLHSVAVYWVFVHDLRFPWADTPGFGNLARLCWLLEDFCGDSADCFQKDACLLHVFVPSIDRIPRIEEKTLLKTMTINCRAWGSFLSRRHVNLDYPLNTFGRTPLMNVSDEKKPGSEISVAVLVGCGADVAATDVYGAQPLHYALTLDFDSYQHSQLRETQLSIIKILITAGADVYAFDCDGASPLDYALYYSTDSVFFEALNHCGVRREDYIREHDRRQADLGRLRGAKRTAVDTEFLESPSRIGLTKRQKRMYEEDI